MYRRMQSWGRMAEEKQGDNRREGAKQCQMEGVGSTGEEGVQAETRKEARLICLPGGVGMGVFSP